MSYKYADPNVQQIGDSWQRTTVRDYVDIIAKILDRTDKFYYRGEKDGEDLSDLDYKTIEKKLADKMFYTSVTIVLVSPGMFENIQEIEQWIPWEISYSLKNKTRSDGCSNMNAVLAVVLPDRNGRYDYAMYYDGLNISVKEEAFFEIILANMFNRRGVRHYRNIYGDPMYSSGNSYIVMTNWSDFRSNPSYYINLALKNRGEWNSFDIVKNIDDKWVS